MVKVTVSGASASSASRRKSDAWHRLVDRVAVVVAKARRNRSVLSTGPEAERLMSEYPNCPMSYAELRETILRLAKEGGVSVQPS